MNQDDLVREIKKLTRKPVIITEENGRAVIRAEMISGGKRFFAEEAISEMEIAECGPLAIMGRLRKILWSAERIRAKEAHT